MVLVALLLVAGESLFGGSMLIQGYITSPVAFVYPNIVRLLLSVALSPCLIYLAIRRVERLGME